MREFGHQTCEHILENLKNVDFGRKITVSTINAKTFGALTSSHLTLALRIKKISESTHSGDSKTVPTAFIALFAAELRLFEV